MVQQGREPGLGGLAGRRVHPLEVRRQGNPALCPDLAFSRGLPSGWALPYIRLVSFDFTGTMNQSDSRPQLGPRLWQCLAAVPHWRPIQWTRSGLSCSDDCLPYRPRRSGIVSHNDDAHAAFVTREHARPPRTSTFRGSFPHPAWLLSTLQTSRCRDARKTRPRLACCGFGRMGLAPTKQSSAWHDVLHPLCAVDHGQIAAKIGQSADAT